MRTFKSILLIALFITGSVMTTNAQNKEVKVKKPEPRVEEKSKVTEPAPKAIEKPAAKHKMQNAQPSPAPSNNDKKVKLKSVKAQNPQVKGKVKPTAKAIGKEKNATSPE